MNRKLVIGLIAALCAALIGSGWQLASRHGVTTTLGPLDLALLRYGIPAFLLLPFLLRHRQRTQREVPGAPAEAASPLWVRITLVLGGGLPFGLLVMAGAQWAPAAHMGVFMAGSMPLFTALGARIFRREIISETRFVGLMAIALGMMIFAIGNTKSGTSTWRGDILFIGAAMLWSAYSLAFKKSKFTAWEGAAYVNGWSALLLLPLVAFVGVPRLLTAPWTDVMLQALGQGLLAGVAGLVAYTMAVCHLGAPRASLSAALVPIFTAFGASWLLGEPLTQHTLVALSFIVPGVVFASGVLARWATSPPIRKVGKVSKPRTAI